jgi:hypothetical protein
MSVLPSGEVLSDRSMAEVHVYLRGRSKWAFVAVGAVAVVVLVGVIGVVVVDGCSWLLVAIDGGRVELHVEGVSESGEVGVIFLRVGGGVMAACVCSEELFAFRPWRHI